MTNHDPEFKLTTDLLLMAYRNGIFPMADDREGEIGWYEPVDRGILEFDDLRITRSLRQSIRNRGYRVTYNRAFREVIAHCASARDETWISEEIEDVYADLHARGAAHSVEVWREGKLIGGLYGVSVGRVFCGESMFHLERDASKVAVVFLVHHLRGCEFEFVDTQFLNPHLERLGARSVSQEEYLERLRSGLDRPADFLTGGRSGVIDIYDR